MYRPNRIGPWLIGNLGKALLVDAKSDFTAVDVAWETYGCYSLNTTSGENFTSEKVVFNDETLFLSDSQQVGIGIQISGIETEQHRHMYSIAGSITFQSSRDMCIELVMGRLASAPSSSANVIVANPIIVPLDVNNRVGGGGIIAYASANTSIITTQVDGGSDPATFFDIAAFWRIVNNDGGNGVFAGLMCNLSIQRYTEDFLTFDPSR